MLSCMEQKESTHPYSRLTPDVILDAVESVGKLVNGRLLALNSYENRVYQVGLEDDSAIIAKFYRPERWSDAAIIEEHQFTISLAQAEIPVVAPLVDADGNTMHVFDGFRFSLYPRRGGRSPDLNLREQRVWLGRFIGRIHALGATQDFVHRPTLSVENFGDASVEYLLGRHILPVELEQSYRSIVDDVLGWVRRNFDSVAWKPIRLHGDCHAGNVLWTDQGPHFVDFDDARMGPAVQDLWMMLSGEPQEMARQFEDIMEGYTQFHEFDRAQLSLVESLRALRMIHHAAWLARRWQDPAFPASFPWFNTVRYWQDHILALREQLAVLQEPDFSRY